MAWILVVDDEPAVAKAVARMARRLGHHVESTTSPVEAVALASRRRPDAVITDIQMPVMDGWALAREIERTLRGECPAFVFLSGRASPGAALPARLRWRFLPKPFESRELAATLRTLLPGRTGPGTT